MIDGPIMQTVAAMAGLILIVSGGQGLVKSGFALAKAGELPEARQGRGYEIVAKWMFLGVAFQAAGFVAILVVLAP